ncbi:hypothetical protein TWF696_001749 [Orbilia brochopaga]|uniref:NACHT domain-containing protein n=1 Tax=Orbilia brochopaga TaxID=3140254 RepID=A0AAV9U982_9PEZI
MDPLSTTASVIAILQLTTTVANYLNGVKNASKDQKRCAIETSNLFALLTSLKYRLEEATSTDPWYDRVRTLTEENGPLSQYKLALEQIVAKAIPKDGPGKVVAALKWPFNKAEVTEIFAAIERLKSLINIALEMDHFKLSEAIKNDTCQIPGAVRDIETLRRRQDDDKRRTIADWISTVDFDKQQTDFSLQRQEGTGGWFLQSPEFAHWLSGTNTFLFCHGIPGAGKTMISSLVIDHLRENTRHKQAAITYLYCNYKKYKEQSAIDLLSALLKQFVQGLSAIPDSVRTLYEKHGQTRSRSSIDEIVATIQSAANCYSETFIIVDALDECPDEHRNPLIATLKRLRAPSVKLMITTRPTITIQEFADPSLSSPDIISLEIKAHREDIDRFVEGQLHRLAGCVSRNAALKQLVTSTINDVSDGMFILAHLLVESLVGETTPKAIRSILNSLPKFKGTNALSRAYEGAIERIKSNAPGHRRLAEQALIWIVWAREPLSVKALQHALATEVGECEIDEENITEISDITSACAGLVAVDDQSDVVRLVHYTAHEYFSDIQTWNSIFPTPHARTAHEDIAQVCLTYLSFNAFATGSCISNSTHYSYFYDLALDLRPRLTRYPLYEYAARNWGHHARMVHNCSTYKEVGDLILNFLKCEAKVSASMDVLLNSLYSKNRDVYGYSAPKPDNPHITAMHLAAYFGLQDSMAALIKTGADPVPRDSWGRSPLFYAAWSGHITVVEEGLAANSIHPDSVDCRGVSLLSYAAMAGHKDVVKLLLASHDIDCSLSSDYGRTPLSYAIEGGHEAVIQLLLAKDGIDPSGTGSASKRTPLMYAARDGNEAIVKLLLADNRVKINSKDKYGRTPLSYASENNVAVVELLLKRDGVDPDTKDNDGCTPLSIAAKMGNEAVVKFLLSIKGVDPDSKDRNGRTPLSYAAERGYVEVAKLLLTKDEVNPDSMDGNGLTPLSWASKSGSSRWDSKEYGAFISLLLAHSSVNPDSKDFEGRTPLSHAAEHGWNERVQLLLAENLVDPNSEDAKGRTPLWYVANQEFEVETVWYLLAGGRVILNTRDATGRTPLSHAAENHCNITAERLLADDRIDADSRDDTGRTPLSYAAEEGNSEIVKLLLASKSVDLNSKDDKGRTPLSYAAGRGSLETIEYLLADDRLSPDSGDLKGRTPLSYAAENRETRVIKRLLREESIDPNSKDINGWTPLLYAVEREMIKAAFLLLSHDRISPYSPFTNDQTLSVWAAENWYQKIVGSIHEWYRLPTDWIKMDLERLSGSWYWKSPHAGLAQALFRGELPTCFEHRERFCKPRRFEIKFEAILPAPSGNWCEIMVRLFLAQEADRLFRLTRYGEIQWQDVMEVLLRNGDIDLNFRDAFGWSLFWCVARMGSEKAVRFLLARGADPESRDNDGQTALSCAAVNGNDKIVELLLTRDDVHPDRQDNAGRTPLMMAASRGHVKVVDLLLADNRVDPNWQAAECNNRTALSIAVERGYAAIVNRLLADDRVHPDLQTHNNWTPLMFAASGGNYAVAKLLLGDDRVDPNSGYPGNQLTPLALASSKGHREVVKLLLKKDGIKPNPRNERNETPLQAAPENGADTVAALLLAKNRVGLDFTDDEDEWTPLFMAARHGHDDVVKILLAAAHENGISLNQRDKHNRTPLWVAAYYGHLEVAKLLLTVSHADLDLRDDKKGWTPLLAAVRRRHYDVERLLLAPAKSDSFTPRLSVGRNTDFRYTRYSSDDESSASM